MAHLPKRAFSSAHSDDVLLTPTVIDFPACHRSYCTAVFTERYPFVLSNVISPRPSVRVREYIFAQIYHRAFLTTRRRTRKSETGRCLRGPLIVTQRKLLFRNFGHSGPTKCYDTEQIVNTVRRLGRGALPMADLLTPIIRDVHIEPAHEVKKRSISQPVRILLSYDESVFSRASTIAIRLNKYGFYRRRLVVMLTMGASNPLRILYNAHRDLYQS
ncbi:hypothetical protein ALC56_05965 [Trachymyrmex septentrionalis]|uniref:Uncharacterized protein n=1 Tax=Trachymyrmex septentrionalis TaxID=34720 RepID=A0A195FGV7_9HYME|nr:hypothetical protein ALC56_05965 [Trachymyrmex septentrionalis]